MEHGGEGDDMEAWLDNELEKLRCDMIDEKGEIENTDNSGASTPLPEQVCLLL